MITFRLFKTITRPLIRRASSKESLVDLSIDREGIALLSMNRQPVNSLNLELLQELSSTIDVVHKNRCKGLVLTSAARIFSAGIDLDELNKPDLNRLRAFWSTIQDLFLKLYGSGETTSAVAINGFNAAGGCVVCLVCDYRVMVVDSKAKIGLNDSVVGIAPRPWLCDLMVRTMGHRQAELALTASTMYGVEEALKVNLVDETATDKDDAIEKCKQFIRKYDNIPIKIRTDIKRNLRENTIKLLTKNREEDLKLFTEGILQPHVQKQIGIFTEQLQSKKTST